MSEDITVTGNKAQFNEDVTFLKDINVGGNIDLNTNSTFTGIDELQIDGSVDIVEDLRVRGNLTVEKQSALAGLTTVGTQLQIINNALERSEKIKPAKFNPIQKSEADYRSKVLNLNQPFFLAEDGTQEDGPPIIENITVTLDPSSTQITLNNTEGINQNFTVSVVSGAGALAPNTTVAAVDSTTVLTLSDPPISGGETVVTFTGPEFEPGDDTLFTALGLLRTNLGINQPNPQSTLDVNGIALIEKIGVNIEDLNQIEQQSNYVLDINGSVLVSVGNSIGIGTPNATQAIHVAESVRIGKQIFDSRNNDGALNAFLSKDANGITWVTQTPAFTEGIFLMDESVFVPTPEAGGQVGAGQSFQTINFVNRNSLGIGTDAFVVTAASVTENGGKGTGLATAFVGDLWGFDTSGGSSASIYRMTKVGIQNAQPNVELDVSGEVHATGNVDFDSALNVDGRVDIGGILDVDGATTLNNTLQVTQNTSLLNNLSVVGNSILEGTLNVQQAVDFDTTLNVDDSTTLQGSLDVSGISNFNNTTDSSNITNGAVVIDGGVGIANTINIGGNANVGSAVSIGSSLGVAGGSTFNDVRAIGISTFENPLESQNKNTGSVVVTGGVGIGKSLNIGGATKVEGNLELDSGLIDVNDTIADPGAGKTDYRLSSVGTGVSWRPSGVQTKRTIWVSKNGLDSNSGLLEGDAKATIGGAAAIAVENDTIVVRPGVYLENNPIGLRTDVSITGQDIRLVIVQPKNPLKDVFHVRRGCLVENLNFGGSNVGVDHSGAACVAFPPPAGSDSAITGYTAPGPATEGPSGRWRSPYIRNCTNFMTGSIGMKVDGDNATASTIGADLKSMVCDSFTQYNENGIGVSLTNDAYAQLVSIFTINTDIGIYASSGAQCDLTNSNSSFGNFGLVAVGLGSTQFTGIVTSISPAGLPIGSTPPDTDVIVCAEVRDDSSGSPIPPFTGAVRRPFDGQALFFQINLDNYPDVVGSGRITKPLERVAEVTVLPGVDVSGYSAIDPPNILIRDADGSSLPKGPQGIIAEATANVSAAGTIGSINVIAQGRNYLSTQNLIVDIEGNTGLATVKTEPIFFTVSEASETSNAGITTITFNEFIPYELFPDDPFSLQRISRILTSSHSFEYVGTGTDINIATPLQGAIPIKANEVVSSDGAQIPFTSTDQKGNFDIGEGIQIDQTTSTIRGRDFARAIQAEVTPLILALR